MNDSCFKAQKEFDKTKQEFVKFPDNMCSQIIFMNIIEWYRITLHLSEKPLRNINGNFTKLLTSEINNRFICSSGQLSNLYQGYSLGNNSNCDHPDTWEPYFQSYYCDVIDNSQTFEKILTAVRLTFST